MKIININVSSKNYNIHIGKGALSACGEIIKSLDFKGKVLVVTDDNVAPLYLDRVENSVKDNGYDVFHIILPILYHIS